MVDQPEAPQAPTLPAPYVAYFASDAPKEGGLAVKPGWFQLWPPTEIEQLNHDFVVGEFGFLAFGSNGGGELLTFDPAGRIFMIPMIGLSPDEAWLVADSWGEFVEKMER